MSIIFTTKELPKRNSYDEYPTPLEVARASLSLLGIQKIDRFNTALDVGAGNGVWGNAFRTVLGNYTNLTGIDIQTFGEPSAYDTWLTGVDYISWKTDSKFDLIFGNPPYYIAEEVINKSRSLLARDGIILLLLRLNFLESIKRYYGLFTEFRPTNVWVSSKRISFTGNKKTDNSVYAIFKWDEVNETNKTDLDWFMWKYDG
jgi:16S rRNA G966 N2-methylase RsmD